MSNFSCDNWVIIVVITMWCYLARNSEIIESCLAIDTSWKWALRAIVLREWSIKWVTVLHLYCSDSASISDTGEESVTFVVFLERVSQLFWSQLVFDLGAFFFHSRTTWLFPKYNSGSLMLPLREKERLDLHRFPRYEEVEAEEGRSHAGICSHGSSCSRPPQTWTLYPSFWLWLEER